MLEGGGEPPWLSPEEFGKIGFSMILYPTTLLFQVTKCMERALDTFKHGKQMAAKEAVDMKEFEKIVEMDYWMEIEKKFLPSSPKDE